MRTKLLNNSLDFFADHEVLEILLYYCYPQINTNTIAHELIKKYGSLKDLFDANPVELINNNVCNERVAILITLMPQIARRYYKMDIGKNTYLSSPEEAGEYAVSLFIGKTKEEFYVICLDTQNRIKNVTLIADGTVNSTYVSTRKVAETAIINQATSVVLTHNHPGKGLKPSTADINTTHGLITALGGIGISVADHIIVSGDSYYSFKRYGKLN